MLDLLWSTQHDEALRQQSECLAYAIEDGPLIPSAMPENPSAKLASRPIASLRGEGRPRPYLTATQRQYQQHVPGSQHQINMMPSSPFRHAPTANYNTSPPGHAHAQYNHMLTAAIPDGHRFNMNKTEQRHRISAAPEPDGNMRSMTRLNKLNETMHRREARLDRELRSLARTNARRRRPRSLQLGDERDKRDCRPTMNGRMGQLELVKSSRREPHAGYMLGQNKPTTRENRAMMPESDVERLQRKEEQLEALSDELQTLEAQYRFLKEEYYARWGEHFERKTRGEPECLHQKQSLDSQRQQLGHVFQRQQNARRRLQDLDLLHATPSAVLQPTEKQQNLEETRESEKNRMACEAESNEYVMIEGLLALDSYNRERIISQHKSAELRLERPFKLAAKENKRRKKRRLKEFQKFQQDQWKEIARLELEEEAYRLKMAELGEGLTWPKFPKWKEEWSTVYQMTRLSLDADPNRRLRFENEGMWFK